MPVEERETSQNIEETAARWVARMDREPLSGPESHALNDWLAGDRRRLGAFMRAQALWMRSESARALGPQYDPADFAQPAALPHRAIPRPRRWMECGGALAASLVLVVALAATLQAPSAYATAKGEMRMVPLGDGATVTLNTDTRIRIHDERGRKRIQLLRGEVLIEDANAATPTLVEVDGRQLVANRASFVVRRFDGQPAQVLVQEGKVEVSGPASATHVSLNANTGMALRARGNDIGRPAPLAAGQMGRELAWREGKIALQGETLAEAAAIYARYSDTPIVIADPELARMQVTGLFATHNPMGFSQAIADVFDAQARRERDRIVVTRAH
nr:FecR domain-containing protein [Pseudoxanthomonas sp.]